MTIDKKLEKLDGGFHSDFLSQRLTGCCHFVYVLLIYLQIKLKALFISVKQMYLCIKMSVCVHQKSKNDFRIIIVNYSFETIIHIFMKMPVYSR